MNNPYSHPQFRRLKRGSKVRYVVGMLVQFPKYCGWQLSKLIPDEIGSRLRKRFGFLVTPIHAVVDFIRLWILTRHWKKLLFAIPLFLALIWLFSTLFLANSQTDEELYGDYRKSLLNAAGEQDYKLADFLAGKLLHNPAYARDEQLLFAAMIAAHENGNIPRRDLLLGRLTGELKSPRAHMWKASQLLSSRSSGEADVHNAIEHIKTAIKLSDKPDGMKVQLINIYYQQRRYQQAINLLGELGTLKPAILVLQAQLYIADGDEDIAYETSMRALAEMDLEDPEKDKYAKERLTALTVLTDMGGSADYVRTHALELVDLLENKKRMNPDDVKIQTNLVQAYMVMGRISLQAKNDISRRKALVYFEKTIAAGEVPYSMGALIYKASNMDSSGGLTKQQMRDALVNGDGVVVAHIVLGLDAWKKDLMDDADFHFRIAHALQPNTLRLVEFVGLHIAQASKEETLNPFRLSLENEPLWRRSLRLLKMSSKIDTSSFERNLYTQCIILSDRQRWAELPLLIEPNLEKLSDTYRIRFLQLLIRSYSETRDSDKVAEYTKMLKAEMVDQER